jgi:two-component system sensor histidine kinase DegS
LHLSIEDDGSGFQIREVMSEERGHRNMGISTMRQQAETLLRGEFGIESAIGRGTRVAAVIPLP